MKTAAIIQKTDSGPEPIKKKTHNLTQSERLAPIIFEGVKTCCALHEKAWSVLEEFFDRAVNTLLRERLIFDVLFQTQKEKVLDSSMVAGFLQQNPLDPVIIIASDSEDEFSLEKMGNRQCEYPCNQIENISITLPRSRYLNFFLWTNWCRSQLDRLPTAIHARLWLF